MIHIEQPELIDWLDELAQRSRLVAPRDVAGVVLYQPVECSQEIAWGFTRPALSIKEAFFPPTERLFAIHRDGDDIQFDETLPEGEQVVFGVRPCDARGALALDALFIDAEPGDPYYTRRRQDTTLVGLACQQLGPTCFCTNVGGAPDDPTGLDLMLTQSGDGYAIHVVTEKGRRLLESAPGLVDRAAPVHEAPIDNSQFTIDDLSSINWPAHFDDDYWAEMSERCLSCRVCAYVCPTCRCFDVRDERLGGNGEAERLRCWDSCARDAYRLIAGGHNPRAVKGQRMRNRFFCKFHYYPQQYPSSTPLACTGCGRCIEACPVNIDITEILKHLVEVSA
ncbi:MAG: 4Fe-4S dicluster domain-containing protein [Anaerolineales bacterium]|nr:4Fe-4S dicluster domain-containing protein [Anaerolineales bacterium]